MLAMAANLFSAHDPTQAIRDWGRMHPLGRIGTPDEVARLVLFLASDAAAFCTGGCYRVDGGLLSAIATQLPEHG
jgi:NAD(P)-dependent dehydrogenase (short-subunit alcohol dehydrogenase family)